MKFTLMAVAIGSAALCAAEEPVWTDDPSSMPQIVEEAKAFDVVPLDRFERNRKRLLIDMDGDGIRDMLLDVPQWTGTGGQGYVVYIANESGRFRRHSTLFFRTGISIEVFLDQRFVWYETGSGASSTLVYQEILPDGLGEAQKIELREWWEEGNNSPLSRELVLAVFNNSDVEGQWEVGNLVDGEMVWTAEEEAASIDSESDDAVPEKP